MGTHLHRLTDVDHESRTATCAVCGPGTEIYRQVNGKGRCAVKSREWQHAYYGRPEIRDRTSAQQGARKYLTGKCASCGFVPEDICQLHADHVDGNAFNNNPDNIQTLCQNCHALKSKREKRGRYKV